MQFVPVVIEITFNDSTCGSLIFHFLKSSFLYIFNSESFVHMYTYTFIHLHTYMYIYSELILCKHIYIWVYSHKYSQNNSIPYKENHIKGSKLMISFFSPRRTKQQNNIKLLNSCTLHIQEVWIETTTLISQWYCVMAWLFFITDSITCPSDLSWIT